MIEIPYKRELDIPRRNIPYSRTLQAPKPAEQEFFLVGLAKPLDHVSATSLLKAIGGLGYTVALEIRVSGEEAHLGLCCNFRQVEELERAVRGAIPDWEITTGSRSAAEGHLQFVATMGLLERPDWAPFRDIKDLGGVEPLTAIFEAVQPLDDGEELVVRYLSRPAGPERVYEALYDLTVPATPMNAIELVAKLVGRGPRWPRFEPHLQRPLEERLEEPLFEVVGTVALTGSGIDYLRSRARNLASVFATNFDCGWGGIALDSWSWRAQTKLSTLRWPDEAPSLLLTVGEMASLWHLPSESVRTVHLKRPITFVSPDIRKGSGLLLGVHRQQGRDVPVYLSRSDVESTHLYVTGETGVGKSTLIGRVGGGLAAEPDRPGLGILDRNADLARGFALHSIPPYREKDVILLDFSDTEFPFGLPFFAEVPGVPLDAQIQTTFGAIKLIFREVWSPTRMEDACFSATATLCQIPGSTLLDFSRLFVDSSFRRKAVARLSDPAVLEFWEDFEALSEGARREVARPILYRLRGFYRSRAVRNIVCQSSGVDFSEITDSRGILLVMLAAAEIEAEADLLGEFILSRLHLAMMARLSRPRNERHPFFLIIDESQHYQGASLPILLAEGRKLGLPLILATQFLDGWSEALARSVLGNVGTTIAFRCGPADGRRLSAILRPFTPEHLEDLDRFEAVAKLQVQGVTHPAFDFRTLPVEQPADEARLDRIRSNSRRKYARPRREVEREIEARLGKLPGNEKGFDVYEE